MHSERDANFPEDRSKVGESAPESVANAARFQAHAYVEGHANGSSDMVKITEIACTGWNLPRYLILRLAQLSRNAYFPVCNRRCLAICCLVLWRLRATVALLWCGAAGVGALRLPQAVRAGQAAASKENAISQLELPARVSF
jgi:hypothetical protein